MDNKLRKKLPSVRPNQSAHSAQQLEQQPEEEEEVVEELSLVPRAIIKDALFVTFTGILNKGFFQQDDSLTAFMSIMHGPDWIRVSGDKSYISQIASSNGKEITWDLPFEISFETTNPVGWPQLVIALYGTDFFGRSFVRGYGNVHLPSRSGQHKRILRLFRPLPQSTISGIFGWLGGTWAEYKDHQKILSSGDGREVTRVKSMGEVSITVQSVKHNFRKYGYE